MKTILITGATDGIGLETAKKLAGEGHHLLMHGRSKEKLDSAIATVQAIAPKVKIDPYLADLSNFDQVRALTSSILESQQKLDVIINNAGIFKTPKPITPDQLDIRFVVNTYAPYIISKNLLPLLSDTGRIINLSSAAQAPIDIEAMTGKVHLQDDFQAYAQSKLAITIWSAQMASSLKEKQVIVAVNPGSLLASKMVKEGFGMAGNDLGIGVNILARAALSEEFSGASGQYFDNDAKQFAKPHHFGQNKNHCDQVMATIDALVSQY